MGVIDDEIASNARARRIAIDAGVPDHMVPDLEDPHPPTLVPLDAYSDGEFEIDDNPPPDGFDDLRRAADQAKEEQHDRTHTTLGIRWVRDAIDSPPPARPYMVHGLLQEGEIAVLAGPRATFKSWWTYDLADRLSTGHGLFLGRLKVTNTYRTLIAQGEIDERNSYERWRAMTETGGIPANVAETFDRWRIKVMNGRTTGFDPDSKTQWADESTSAVMDRRVEQAVEDHGFNLLIVDPWAVYFNGKENSNDEAERALDQLRDLAHRTGCAVLIVHHITAKGGSLHNGGDPEDLWRGASRLADWASTRITLLPHYKTPKEMKSAGLNRIQARRVVDVHFLRRGEALDDFTIEWDPRTYRWNEWTAPARTEPDAGRSAALTPVEVARRLAATGVTEWPSGRAVSAALGLGYAAAAKYLDPAVAAGYLTTTKRGTAVAYRLTGSHPPPDLDGPPADLPPVDAYEGHVPDDEMPDPHGQEF